MGASILPFSSFGTPHVRAIYSFFISPRFILSDKIAPENGFLATRTTPEVSAYKANINETGAYTIEETPISINWQSSLSNSEWSYGKFFVEEPCQIALFMHYGAISLFASDAEGDEATGISNIATDNNTKCILNGEMLTISSESNLNSYQIFNINGSTIATGYIIGNAIQIQLNTPAGIYFISVNGENGTSIHRTIKK